jgi:tRNA U34 5-carboxymethylaminomethyl modifying GTPase MnmE/TrmE
MKLLISSLLLLLSTAAYADTASDIEKAILDNFEHMQNEDADAVMEDMHSQACQQTQQMLQQFYLDYDLKYELLNYKFVGEDNEYAYAKVKQLTTRISGPEFKNNETEMLVIFKQENGLWKEWAHALLSTTHI